MATQECQLFLPFCASARGLIEAVADSYDGFIDVPEVFSRQEHYITLALKREPQDKYLDFGPVENTLLHFSHARRLTREERLHQPEFARAKELGATIASTLDGFEPYGFREWWSELCELTHPASDSVCYLLVPKLDGRLSFLPSIDEQLLDTLLVQHRSRLAELLRLSIVPAMLMLKVLLHFPLPGVHVNYMRSVDLSSIRAWAKCASLLAAAESAR